MTRASRSQRRFYVGIGVASALSVLLGFGSSLYQRPAVADPPLSPLVWFHACLFAGWVLLFIAQGALVASGQGKLHRRLGVFGVVMAAAMLVVGYLTAIAAARHGHNPGGLFPDAIGFLAIPAGDLVVFGSFVALAFAYRGSPEVHKRLMVLALVGGLVPASFSRLPFIGDSPVGIALVTIAFLGAGPVFDLRARSSIHAVYTIGAPVAFLTLPLRIAIGHSGLWRSAMNWLIS